ncbi:MAG: FAD-dependent oxidoreductase, partial [Armatimonadetes bacterium]|nr:FAD-dependent oxidoreductase [Armatimonadota bacterium]
MPEYKADVLVIGAGGAGLRAAIAARENGADVLVVEKGVAGEAGCTRNSASDWMAYGAAFGHADPNDSPHEHWLDIMIKGALVARPELARRIAFEAPDRLLDLESYGASFDKDDGKFVQILSDGARFPRACGKGTDTGPEIVRVLLAKARELGVRFAQRTMVGDLVICESPQRRIIGCWGLDLDSGDLAVFSTPAVIIATGG